VWCWRRTWNVIWTDHARNEVLREVKDRDMLRTVQRRKADWIGHIFRRYCFLKHVIDGRMDGWMDGQR
jgi:hypothetical protein